MSDAVLAEILNRVAQTEAAIKQLAEEALVQLEKVHPLLARQLLETFDHDREKAASWLLVRPTLGGQRPLEHVMDGQSEHVAEILGRIEHGIYS